VDALPRNTLLKHAERIWDAVRADGQPLFKRQGGAQG
jgi:hypothetical protein